MQLPRYFVDDPLTQGSLVTLSERQGHHLLRVLRRGADAVVELVDPRERAWSALIVRTDPKQCELEVLARVERDAESPLRVHLAIPVLRSARLDLAVQKATELGVSEIVLFTSERTELSRLTPSKLEHLKAVAESAAQQSGRLRRPSIIQPRQFRDHLQAAAADRQLLFHPGSPAPDFAGAPQSVAAISGPEGGFSDIELAAASAEGWEIVGLGPRTLRAETAPMAIATVVQAMWGDLRAPSTTDQDHA